MISKMVKTMLKHTQLTITTQRKTHTMPIAGKR